MNFEIILSTKLQLFDVNVCKNCPTMQRGVVKEINMCVNPFQQQTNRVQIVDVFIEAILTFCVNLH